MAIFLYKKTHNKTGLQYLGKTKNKPQIYTGSGIKWLRHLKKWGNDVTTEIIKVCETEKDLKYWGIFYSKKWNIVESNDWANLKMEEGDGGDMSSSVRYINSRKTKEFRKKQSDGAKGNTNVRGYRWWSNGLVHKRSKESPGDNYYLKSPDIKDSARKKISEKNKGRILTDQHKEKLSISAKNRKPNSKGTIWVKNKQNIRKRVYPENIPEGFFSVKELNDKENKN